MKEPKLKFNFNIVFCFFVFVFLLLSILYIIKEINNQSTENFTPMLRPHIRTFHRHYHSTMKKYGPKVIWLKIKKRFFFNNKVT